MALTKTVMNVEPPMMQKKDEIPAKLDRAEVKSLFSIVYLLI